MKILFFLGLFLIICGIGTKYKKWLWIHQGLLERPVDVEKYTNYMGNIDIIWGSCCIILGFASYYTKIPQMVALIISIVLWVFTIYGEVKYRKR